ncbi:hypothetical protein SBY92_005181 [Candida maltosa Xu316]
MVLNIFTAKKSQSDPQNLETPITPKQKPKPKRKPQQKPVQNQPSDATKGVAYKSSRIILPGSGQSNSPDPNTSKNTQQQSTTTSSSTPRNHRNNPNHVRKKPPTHDLVQRNTKQNRDRVVVRRRPVRGTRIDRRGSISSRESLASKERRPKNISKRKKVAFQEDSPAATTGNPNLPYPIHDIADDVSVRLRVDSEDEGDDIPSGFEQVNRNQLTRRKTQKALSRSMSYNTLTGTSRQPTTVESSSSALDPRVGSSSSAMESSVSQLSTATEYHDAVEPTIIEAVACILERTGSSARDSRRAQRARELRQSQQPRVSTGSGTRTSNHSDSPQSVRTPTNQPRDTNQVPVPSMHIPVLIIPDLTSQQRHSPNTNGHNHTSTNDPTPLQRLSRLEETRNAIISRLNAPIDTSMYPVDLLDPPPLDEYSDSVNTTNSNQSHDHSPPYREKLHRKVDLISFDPRYSIPVLRINKKLVKNNANLKKVIRKMHQLNIVPEEVNLWDINKVEDAEFYSILPSLLQNDDRQQQPDEYEDAIQRAIALSLEEENQRELFRGFRYQSSHRVIEQIVQSPDFDLNHGRFVDANEVNQSSSCTPVEGNSQRDVFRGFRYNEASSAIDQVIQSPVLDQIEDEFIDVDQAVTNWNNNQYEERETNRTLLAPPRFGYLHPHHTQSSNSSFMTAY